MANVRRSLKKRSLRKLERQIVRTEGVNASLRDGIYEAHRTVAKMRDVNNILRKQRLEFLFIVQGALYAGQICLATPLGRSAEIALRRCSYLFFFLQCSCGASQHVAYVWSNPQSMITFVPAIVSGIETHVPDDAKRVQRRHDHEQDSEHCGEACVAEVNAESASASSPLPADQTCFECGGDVEKCKGCPSSNMPKR